MIGKKRCLALVLSLAALLFGPGKWASADTGSNKLVSTPAEQQSVSITIYNDNLGLVKDVRTVSMPRGLTALTFEGVAARIDPTSVSIISVNFPKQLDILEQNFEYDLISPAKLMEKYLGKEVELITTFELEEKIVTAVLLGIHEGWVYEIGGKIAINPPGRVVLPELPEGLISKPSLVWLLDSDRLDHTVEASYLTEGIGWKANYVAILDQNDTRMDLSGWVTIDNQSGATYQNASLKLVAGDVNRVAQFRTPGPRDELYVQERIILGMKSDFQEETFFEYHLYTLQRPATLRDNQTKQLSLLGASDIKAHKSFVYSPLASYFFSSMPAPEKGKKVGVFIDVENKKQNNLGMPLPKGVVRVYKKDQTGDLQFIGEDWVDHTPEDEKIRIKMGEAFDVVADRVQTDFKILMSGRLYESVYQISIRNHKKEDIVVSVVERLQGDWRIIHHSHEYEKESSHRVRFDVPVPREGTVDLTYTVQIKY